MRNREIARNQCVLISIGLLSFLTMITYLVSSLTYGTNSPLADLAENVLRSFPFMMLIAYLDYLLVRHENLPLIKNRFMIRFRKKCVLL